jgi:hypothetical protein
VIIETTAADRATATLNAMIMFEFIMSAVSNTCALATEAVAGAVDRCVTFRASAHEIFSGETTSRLAGSGDGEAWTQVYSFAGQT